jgi:hypothetical protein
MNDLDTSYGVPTGYVPRIRESATDYDPRDHHGFVIGKIEQLSTDTVPSTGNTSMTSATNKIPEPQEVKTNHSHYFKSVKHLDEIDVYRVLDLFEVTDPCIQHTVKKLLVAGGRGAGKGFDKDIQEAIDSLKRLQVMRSEDVSVG